jgi:UDP-N-acetylmuramoylalanine--D-glutamate ligase
MDLVGKRVTVMGMARSGLSAARLALRKGAHVTCTDRKPDAPPVEGATCVYGAHRREDFTGADLVVVSPGVPAAAPDVQAALAAGVPVLGELAFAAQYLQAPLLAVTGTNGKSTTTHLLAQLLAQAGLRTFAGGNLGRPLSDAVDEPIDVVAVEVSSYQMELPGRFHPRAAAVLNLTPDHLERHGDMETYAAHKCRVFARMGPGDAAIVPAGDPRLVRIADTLPGTRWFLGAHPGVRVARDTLVIEGLEDSGEVPLGAFPLPGPHNRENLAAAVLLAMTGAGLRRAQLDLSRVEGLAHRLQPVAVRRGITWIDDSKATNVDSTLVALRAVTLPDTWVLLGGQGKAGSPWNLLADPLRRAAGVLTFGASGDAIAEVLAGEGLPVERATTLEDAMRRAAARARAGQSVLLSPSCASFDAFTDYEHRGRAFRAHAEDMP